MDIKGSTLYSSTSSIHCKPPHTPHQPSLDLEVLAANYDPSHYVYESSASRSSRMIIETASFQTTPSFTPPISKTPIPPAKPMLAPQPYKGPKSQLLSVNNGKRNPNPVRLPAQDVCGPQEDIEEAFFLDAMRRPMNESHNTSTRMRSIEKENKDGGDDLGEGRGKLQGSGDVLLSEMEIL